MLLEVVETVSAQTRLSSRFCFCVNSGVGNGALHGGLKSCSVPFLEGTGMFWTKGFVFFSCSVPTVPVKNLNGSSPVHPALAGKNPHSHESGRQLQTAHDPHQTVSCFTPGITGILMSAAALPVCLTRPPKLVLHPPPVSKSDIKPVSGFSHCCSKTTKKQARKGKNH